jgi:UBX domain-containing protein 1
MIRKGQNNKEGFDKTGNKIKLTVYRNGFTIDDGPFRDKSLPENKKFMEEVEKGYIPDELVQKGYKELGIALEDKKTEDYKEPVVEKKFQAFTGSGQSMGGSQSVGLEVNKDIKNTVNNNLPTTRINIRLHTGEMITEEFNTSSTVNDIIAFVQKVAPVTGSFQLVDGFPPKPLSELNKSIDELKLQGTTLIQRLC